MIVRRIVEISEDDVMTYQSYYLPRATTLSSASANARNGASRRWLEDKYTLRRRSYIYHKKGQAFVLTALLANCRGYKIGDKVDGTVSEQVETEQNCSLVICDYGKYKNCMILRLLGDKKANKTENMAGLVFLRVK